MVRYHSIGTGDSGSFRVRNLGNLEAITREVIPWGWELTSKGNLLTSVLDLTQFRNRALKAINAGDPTLGRLYNNDLKLIEGDLKQWMDNHRQDLPGSNKIGEQRRDAINSLIGIATNVNKGANPFSGKIAGPSSAIKQFRLDRLDAATGTGRTGFHFDYEKANGNLLPEIPTPLPDLSRDLPGQALPDRTQHQQNLSQALENQNFADINFGTLSKSKFDKINEIRGGLGVEVLTDRNLVLPKKVVKKLYDKRMVENGMSADQVADLVYSLFHSRKTKITGSKNKHIQTLINMREDLSRVGFISTNPSTNETVIKSARVGRTEDVVKDIRKSALGGPAVTSIVKPE
jgi:hypothetical protein